MFPRLSAFDYKDCKLFPNFFCGICCPIDLTRACTGQRKSRKNTEQMKDEIGNYKLQPQTGCSLVRSHREPWCFLGSQHLTTKTANFSQTFFATFCHPSLDTGMHPTTAMSLHSNALSDIMFPSHHPTEVWVKKGLTNFHSLCSLNQRGQVFSDHLTATDAAVDEQPT